MRKNNINHRKLFREAAEELGVFSKDELMKLYLAKAGDKSEENQALFNSYFNRYKSGDETIEFVLKNDGKYQFQRKPKNGSRSGSKTLYHYTSFEAFLAIIKNKTLRLSDLTKSNDSAEIVALWKSNMKATFVGHSINDFIWLGLCLTELDDDLHMWSSYGSKGVRIGFDCEELKKWVNQIARDVGLQETNDGRNLQKVHYDLESRASSGVNDPNLLLRSAFTKSVHFAAEKEWRLVIPFLKKVLINKNALPFLNVTSADFPFENTSLIHDIKVAHNAYIKTPYLEDLLRGCGFDTESIKVTESKVTLK